MGINGSVPYYINFFRDLVWAAEVQFQIERKAKVTYKFLEGKRKVGRARSRRLENKKNELHRLKEKRRPKNRHLQWGAARLSEDHRPKEYESVCEKLHINQWHFFLLLFSAEEYYV
jgi:hypothetical protein